MKTCTVCGESKPLSAYHKNKSSGDGHAWRCKACAKITTKTWYRANQLRGIVNVARARARTAGIPFDLDANDLTIPEVCPVLGIPLALGGGRGFQWSSPSLDRLNPARGYVRDNVRVISFRANSVKSDGTAAEHRAIAEYIERETT